MFPVTFPTTLPVNPFDVIVPSELPASAKVIVPPSASRVIPPPEFKVTVVPANSAVPSAVIVILAAAPAASVVAIVNVPSLPAVNIAVSLVSPVIVITFPFIFMLSIVASSATRASMFAVPSRYKFLHS